MENNYIYIILDKTIQGEWFYKDILFKYKPIYVGMGSGNRYKSHLTSKLRKRETNLLKFNIIKSLIESGNTPLSIKVYENLSRIDAEKIETDIIKKFGKIINNTGILTNISNGGEHSPFYNKSGENTNSKKVYQYDLQGNFIKEWDCLREVGRILNKSFISIGDCCRGRSRVSHGYQWSYDLKEMYPIIVGENIRAQKKVYKFDDNGLLIKEYKSLKEACSDIHISKSLLSSIILNGRNYLNFMYSYDKDFKVDFNRLTHFHKIDVNGEIMNLTNKEIMQMFNVSKQYFSIVKSNKIKKPKFKVIY